jgi:hypothetical protein
MIQKEYFTVTGNILPSAIGNRIMHQSKQVAAFRIMRRLGAGFAYEKSGFAVPGE